MYVRIKGQKEVIDALHRTEKRYGVAMQHAVLAGGTFLLKESNEIVPVDTGRLQRSGYVLRSGSGLGSTATVGYRAPYALYVHEDLGAAHGRDYNIKYAEQIANKETYTYDGQVRVYHARRDQERAKFLEFVVRTKWNEMLAIVRQEFYRYAK